jgi:hypothetical protein
LAPPAALLYASGLMMERAWRYMLLLLLLLQAF